MKTVAFHTLGCKLNFSETSAIGRQFLQAGFLKKEFSEPADIYVINTCSVTENANKKCRRIIRQVLNQNSDAYIIIAGCYAQLKPSEIAEIPGVDLVVGAGDKFRILELVSDFKKTPNPCVFNSQIAEINDFRDAFSIGDRTRSFLKIQDGCDYKCAFCTIPLARGKSRSDSIENILANAAKIAESGVKEIVLTGVNIGDYGQDQPHEFLDVVKALDQSDVLKGIERIRISSIEPNLLKDEIIEYVAGSNRFMPHFHIPLQSGSNEILASMRRRYRKELYIERVAKIRKLMPHASIGVDVIVGFPGETEKHFEESWQFLHDLPVSYLHVFTYSERENTHAVTLPGVIPVKERHGRSQRLRQLSAMKKRFFYQQFAEQTQDVLFEGKNEDGFIFGFSRNYIRVGIPYQASLINQLVEVKLTGMDTRGNMKGELLSKLPAAV